MNRNAIWKMFGLFLFSVALTLALYPTALAASTTHTESIEVDGIVYSFALNDAANTAAVKKIADPASPTDVTIPDQITFGGNTYTVTELKFGSYSWDWDHKCSNITTLKLPNTLTDVCGSTFVFFPNLTSLTIPGSVKCFDGSFQGCRKLISLTFEEGVEVIDRNMMIYETPVETVNLPASLTTLGEAVFNRAESLVEIELPASVTEIPYAAFESCTSLKRVTVQGKLTSIGSSAFSKCTALETFSADRSELSDIGSSAFRECSSLTTIPDLSHVTEMGNYAFYQCKALRSRVDLSSLSRIPDYAFGYTYVTVTALNDRLASIGKWAFIWAYMGLSTDEAFAFPETLESIGDYAFYYCDFPSTVVIPDTVATMGIGAFKNANNIETLHIGSGVTEIAEEALLVNNEDRDGNPRKITFIFNNSQDDVFGDLPAEGEFVEIVYLKKSIAGAGDKISVDADAMTLQEAVNAAPDGVPTTITISKDVELGSTLIIPAGKNVTICSENDELICAQRDIGIDQLIRVEEGASVAFGGNLLLRGNNNSGSVIASRGVVTLTENATVADCLLSRANGNTGVIQLDGENAKLIMTGGFVESNIIGAPKSATIRVSGGASVSIRGGAIRNNSVRNGMYDASSGILLYENSTGEMTGGTIENNSAVRGSAIMLYSYRDGESRNARFTLSGGVIRGNVCLDTDAMDASGAVHVEGNASFTMKGSAVITENQGNCGAGVCVLDPGIQAGTGEFHTAFVMEGGTISNNQGSIGGGIYSYSNDVLLKAGTISGNHAMMGGGVYSEGNKDTYSTLHMENAVITENSSEDQGGGLWFCSTGSATVHVKNGGAIYGNTASGAGDDLISVAANRGSASSVTLADRVLGGGKVLWYQDGSIYRADESLIFASTNRNAPRYGQAGANTTPIQVKDNQAHLALKSLIDPTAQELARQQAKLFITGNSAVARGGGVAANGGIVIGEFTDDLINIPVKKLWDHGENPESAHPDSVTVKLMLGQVVMDTLVLTEKDGWAGMFYDLPRASGYTIVEEVVTNYQVVVTGNEDEGFTLQNTYNPSVGSLKVSKTVLSPTPDTAKSFTFTVTLSDLSISGTYGDMLFDHGIAVFPLKHGESKTASGLEAGISYSVAEGDHDGYTVTATGQTGTIQENLTSEAVFVNTENIPLVPETGDPDQPMLWSVLLSLTILGMVGIILYSRKKRSE